ncbi:histidinol dehydrogenase [Lederbergia lenta]|uniref:Histidinol dehydrogenase n=1 Tax=Lederbergia lenta TaxID=1467 RepID=A0A2X4VPD6_LEDLE|nr:histidinol dehydrogenase [Lederbergia lenta]MCM3110949.1 histidinol dehydrogenase [Lederbergia lenta]MEC2325655.1 histidinol dehydrogenase [Lederbergia lenta]SQI54047.1 histidinol dehydrogenase [Lederbergia lenta]
MISAYSKDQFTNHFISRKTKKKPFDDEVMETVKEVIENVRNRGEVALKEYTKKFDGGIPNEWIVSEEERKAAWNEVSSDVIESLQKAAENIRSFHSKQLQQTRMMEMTEEIISGQLFRPIERVGVYVPGGKAVYPSTVLMNAIPAVLAGVNQIVMTTPSRGGGAISPILSVAADIAGVHTIYKMGGSQAIAVLAYGIDGIQPVDKIVGPGNAYVAAAKSLVFGDVGIEMIAGPSEVAIIADETANPRFIAADLIAQAEHDEKARPFVFSTSQRVLDETMIEVRKQCEVLPRKEIAEVALTNEGAAVFVKTIEEAFQLVNALAPEHLELQIDDALAHLSKVKNAGSVFIGHYTPESVGDYFAGPNHVLPTSGTARFSSGLSVDDFIKKTTFVYYSEQALQHAAPHIESIAFEEQLEGHARAVKVRLEQ